MAKSVMKTVLVISKPEDDPQIIIDKYSADTKVEPYIWMYKKEAGTKKKEFEELLSSIVKSTELPLTDRSREYYKDLLYTVKEMSDEDYFLERTDGLEYDKDGNAISTINPNAHYKYPRCYQFRLDKTGEEAEFSNPFHLLDGTKAYQAKVSDIDWERENGYNKNLYENAWDICVNGKEPLTEQEKIIKENMSNRSEYFAQFKNKEQYVRHSTSFFTFGVATMDWYKEVDWSISDMDWVAGFYDRFIKNLDGDMVLSIYEVRSL